MTKENYAHYDIIDAEELRAIADFLDKNPTRPADTTRPNENIACAVLYYDIDYTDPKQLRIANLAEYEATASQRAAKTEAGRETSNIGAPRCPHCKTEAREFEGDCMDRHIECKGCGRTYASVADSVLAYFTMPLPKADVTEAVLAPGQHRDSRP